ncbi:MAG: hypothetical protein AB7E80_12545 [Hyphomicrobiaceae bacterium]
MQTKFAKTISTHLIPVSREALKTFSAWIAGPLAARYSSCDAVHNLTIIEGDIFGEIAPEFQLVLRGNTNSPPVPPASAQKY